MELLEDTQPETAQARRRRRLRAALVLALTGFAGLVWVFALPFPTEELRREPVVSTVIVDRHGNVLREVLSDNEGRGRWLALGDISPHLVAATIHAEDKRFFDHVGVDPIAIARSMLTNLTEMKLVTGASTLTQQTVKLVRHQSRNRNLWTKLSEVVWALRLERTLTKDEILEHYLNRAPYGNQLHGVEAAARMYFGKSASQLSLAEATLLAGLPQAPTTYNPYRNMKAAQDRARWILGKMFARGAITEEQYQRAIDEPVLLREKDAPFIAPHFTEYVLRDRGELEPGEIRTSLNLETQTMVEGVVDAELSRLEGRNVSQAAVVVLDTQSVEVLAWVGSRDYWDVASAGANDGVTALRQPGSALKPFVYGLYLEEGGTAADMLTDLPTQFPTADGVYVPKNYSRRFTGPVSLRDALASSLNIPAVSVASEVGVPRLLERLELAGLETFDLPPEHYGLGLALGDGEVRLVDLTAAYAALGRLGSYRPPRATLDPVRAAEPDGARRVFEADTAYILLDILSDDRARRIGFGEAGPLALPYKMAAKTGTSTDFRDNWAVGVTPDYTVGVWVGNFDGSPMNKVSGATGAAPILRQVFQALYPDAGGTGDVAWFRRPRGVREARVCSLSGSPAASSCPHQRVDLFTRGQKGASSERREGNLRHPGPDTCQIHRAVAIDSRNGLLASDSCPPDVVERVAFDAVPAGWVEWALDAGLNLPPAQNSPLCAGSPDTADLRSLAIVHPLPGDRFTLDSSVPAEAQQMTLRAKVAGNPRTVTWFVDGAPIGEASSPYTFRWRLRPGRHTIGVGADRETSSVEVVIDEQ